MGYGVVHTEHAGPKNRRGYWGLKVVAKSGARRRRRQDDRAVCEEGLVDAQIEADVDSLEDC